MGLSAGTSFCTCNGYTHRYQLGEGEGHGPSSDDAWPQPLTYKYGHKRIVSVRVCRRMGGYGSCGVDVDEARREREGDSMSVVVVVASSFT